MMKSKIIKIELQAVLFTIIFLCSIDKAAAENIDTFSFCLNSCKEELCNSNKSLKSECQRKCSKDNIWQQVAKLEISRNNAYRKELREEKDPIKKANRYNALINGTEIAKCIDQTVQVEKEALAKELAAKEQVAKDLAMKESIKGMSNTTPSPERAPISQEDLCAAALKQEMSALRNNLAALKIQEMNIENALKNFEKGAAK